MPEPRLPLAAALLVVLAGCRAPVVKTDALDEALLARRPLPADQLEADGRGEWRLTPGAAWLADVDPAARLTFAGWRTGGGGVVFAVVLVCDPAADRLVLLPLHADETPLDVLGSADRAAALRAATRADADALAEHVIETSLRDAIEQRRLGPPIPTPRHVFAVAANYPSHLAHDLARRDTASKRRALAAARPRVFLKFPPTPPPEVATTIPPALGEIIGPFDTLEYTDRIVVTVDDLGVPTEVPAAVDYEVEIGVVIGETLDAETVAGRTDDELRAAVAGLVLVSDAKARNPQVYLKVSEDDTLPPPDNPYRFDHGSLDKAATIWRPRSCQWWSYAASWGRFTSIGPLFVAGAADLAGTRRPLLSARSYADAAGRAFPPPRDAEPDVLYLRQASSTTTDPSYADALVWTLPRIIRSIVEPGTALSFMDGPVRLERGDVICLGTPGGTSITSKPYWLFDAAEGLLFFRKPLDWHDTFFKKMGAYLHEGDRLFMWSEGLGYQHLDVKRLEPPTTPAPPSASSRRPPASRRAAR
jgi:2-keto-4-pentenoate hydratase/2-oxohepta-3-ene-1,7-dioic acid hydratase in catechol pathway